MNRRSLIKSLLPMMAGILLFKNISGSYESYIYKGKKLTIVSSDILQDIANKKELALPKYQSNKSILDEMKMFVDMSEKYEFGYEVYEVYGCVYEDGNYSVVSFG
jgi:hypothetical protein